ncbi:cohesin subunit SA-2-like, partial [Asbolus verrucosus]
KERESEQSKTTSTPRTGNTPAFSLSPSISSISHNEDSMEVDISDAENSNESSSNIRSTLEDIESPMDESTTDDIQRLLTKAKSIKWTGFWSSLKPKNKNSLYFRIMTEPADAESIVVDLFNLYNRNPEEGTMLILQLLVDLCGYKKLSIDKVYKFEQGNSKDVVKMMESDFLEPELRTVIDSFIALKFLTALVTLYKQFLAFLQEHTVDENSNTVEILDERKSTIENSIDFLYLIYDKNWLVLPLIALFIKLKYFVSCSLIPDKKCYIIRAKCAQEMVQWINLFPEIFIIKRRCLGRLMKLIVDHNEFVRKTALCACAKLMTSSSDELHNELKKRIELYLKFVSTRFIDTNYKIAMKAIAIFTAAIYRYSDHITKEYKMSIIQIIYNKNLLLAKTAGKFLVTYLRSQNRSDEQLLLSLSKIAFLTREFGERVPFLVESCIEFSNELQNWNVIVINLLLKHEIELNTRKHVLELMKESIRYSLTGRCSKSRHFIQEDSPQPADEHIAVADSIIPHFEGLVLTFQNDKKCLNHLVEILTFINFNHCRSKNLNPYYTEIFVLLKELFQTTTDKILIENICTIFSWFCEKQICYRLNANLNVLLFQIFDSVCDFYQIFGKELKRKRQFANFIIEINEINSQEILFKFLIHSVIENTTLPLTQRQKYLSKIADVIYLKAVPLDCFSKILRFYHTHYEEFGEIMNNILNQLQLNNPALPLLIMHTLAEIYKRIREQGPINILSEQSKQLKVKKSKHVIKHCIVIMLQFLSKKLAQTKVMKSQNDTLKLVNMAMSFAFSSEQNYPFLYFIRYFVRTLKEDAKSDA